MSNVANPCMMEQTMSDGTNEFLVNSVPFFGVAVVSAKKLAFLEDDLKIKDELTASQHCAPHYTMQHFFRFMFINRISQILKKHFICSNHHHYHYHNDIPSF